MTAMQELVVPRSMPKTFAIKNQWVDITIFRTSPPLQCNYDAGGNEFQEKPISPFGIRGLIAFCLGGKTAKPVPGVPL
jgi:hypothetical protein